MERNFKNLLLLLTCLFILSSCTSHPATSNGSWAYYWGDEFNYSGAPDPSKWSMVNYYQYTDRRKNVRVENGLLVIEAHREAYNGQNYTSGMIRTGDTNALDYMGTYGTHILFQYGRFEIRAKLAPGKGTWNAIWLIGQWVNTTSGFATCGEIDINETLGNNPEQAYVTTHVHRWTDPFSGDRDDIQRGSSVDFPGLCHDFHVYACEWDTDTIRFYIDDQLVWTRNISDTEHYGVFDREMALTINLEIGGWGGEADDSIFPVSILVDYVRVYRKQSI